MTIPIPGDLIEVRSPGTRNGEEAIVVASVIYREADEELKNDRFTLLLLMKESPFYLTVIVEDKSFNLVTINGKPMQSFIIETGYAHHNLVDAVNGNDYPHPDPSQPGRMMGPRSLGYVDMGGDV